MRIRLYENLLIWESAYTRIRLTLLIDKHSSLFCSTEENKLYKIDTNSPNY